MIRVRQIAAVFTVAVAALLASGSAVQAAPASAQAAIITPAICPSAAHPMSAWVDGASWGRFRWCVNTDQYGTRFYRFELEDTATDGYQVHLEFYVAGGFNIYYDIPTMQPNCGVWETLADAGGASEWSCWGGPHTYYDWSWSGNPGARIVRGRGEVPGPHQFTASNFAWLV